MRRPATEVPSIATPIDRMWIPMHGPTTPADTRTPHDQPVDECDEPRGVSP